MVERVRSSLSGPAQVGVLKAAGGVGSLKSPDTFCVHQSNNKEEAAALFRYFRHVYTCNLSSFSTVILICPFLMTAECSGRQSNEGLLLINNRGNVTVVQAGPQSSDFVKHHKHPKLFKRLAASVFLNTFNL